MGLRDQAKADAKAILNDSVGGAGSLLSIYDPVSPAVPISFVGFANDISLTIDPETNEYVSGRRVTVALSLTDVDEAELSGMPDAVADTTGRPWVVEFDDATWKVARSMPDRTVNILLLELEAYT